MSKRFIVAIDSSTKEQNDAFLEFVKENGLGWWHWLTDFWLLTDSSGKFRADEVRDVLDKTHPGIDKIVIELNDTGDTWSGFGPKGKQRNIFTWLHNTWSKYR